MVRSACGGLAALCLSFGLSGCFPIWSHSAWERIHDNQVTYDDFNDTMDYGTGFAPADAIPPMPVHEFNHDTVAAAGGVKAVDGRDWFAADGAERNDMLNRINEKLPNGAAVVMEIATGDIWVIPRSAGDVFKSFTITPWTRPEYENLPDYVADTTGFGYYGASLPAYRQLTAIAVNSALHPVSFIHPLGALALSSVVSANGIAFAPYPKWRLLTPEQRLGLLLNLQRYLLMTAYFQLATNQFLFGVSIPDGYIYALPQLAMARLLVSLTIRPWTPEQQLLLTTVGALQAIILLRAIRNERIIQEIRRED